MRSLAFRLLVIRERTKNPPPPSSNAFPDQHGDPFVSMRSPDDVAHGLEIIGEHFRQTALLRAQVLSLFTLIAGTSAAARSMGCARSSPSRGRDSTSGTEATAGSRRTMTSVSPSVP